MRERQKWRMAPLVGIALSMTLLMFGCEDDSPSWTTPDSVRGTWRATEMKSDFLEAMEISLSQSGTAVSGRMAMTRRGNVFNYKGSGTYENGILAMSWGYGTDYYRFADDGAMYEGATPDCDPWIYRFELSEATGD